MVERSLSMGEGWGSIPHTSITFCSRTNNPTLFAPTFDLFRNLARSPMNLLTKLSTINGSERIERKGKEKTDHVRV